MSNVTQHAMFRKLGGRWGTPCQNRVPSYARKFHGKMFTKSNQSSECDVKAFMLHFYGILENFTIHGPRDP